MYDLLSDNLTGFWNFWCRFSPTSGSDTMLFKVFLSWELGLFTIFVEKLPVKSSPDSYFIFTTQLLSNLRSKIVMHMEYRSSKWKINTTIRCPNERIVTGLWNFENRSLTFWEFLDKFLSFGTVCNIAALIRQLA